MHEDGFRAAELDLGGDHVVREIDAVMSVPDAAASLSDGVSSDADGARHLRARRDQVDGPPAGVASASPAETQDLMVYVASLSQEAGDIVYVLQIEPDLRFEMVSERVVGHVGYTAEALLEDPGLMSRAVDPRDQQLLHATLGCEVGATFEVELRWVHRGGHTVWTHHRGRKRARPDGTVVIEGYGRDITDQRQAELALATTQRQYRLLADNASDVVVQTDVDGRLVWVSSSVESTLGWRPEELLGRTVIELMHPEDLSRIEDESLEGIGVGDSTARSEARYAKADGGWRWMSMVARPLHDASGQLVGAVESLRDIQAEIDARMVLATAAVRLARSEQRFRLAMASAPVGMAVVDLELRLLEVNQALVRMLGREEAWLLGHSVPDVLDPRDRWVDLRLRAEVLAGRAPAATRTQRLITADGSPVIVRHAVGVLPDDDGRPTSYVSQFVDVTETHQAQEQLRFLASHDSLTSLANRRELTTRMTRILGHPPRTGTKVGVLFIDVDGLKTVNDTMGHAAGDQLLVEAAHRISSQVRSDDLVARIGGDEFVVMLPSIHELDDVVRIAAKIHRAFELPIVVHDDPHRISVSVGAAVADPGDDTDKVLSQADHALYRAKREGRNRTAAYDPSLDG